MFCSKKGPVERDVDLSIFNRAALVPVGNCLEAGVRLAPYRTFRTGS